MGEDTPAGYGHRANREFQTPGMDYNLVGNMKNNAQRGETRGA